MKPRLVIEVTQPLLRKLNAIAAELSLTSDHKISRSELVLTTLYEKYPELKDIK